MLWRGSFGAGGGITHSWTTLTAMRTKIHVVNGHSISLGHAEVKSPDCGPNAMDQVGTALADNCPDYPGHEPAQIVAGRAIDCPAGLQSGLESHCGRTADKWPARLPARHRVMLGEPRPRLAGCLAPGSAAGSGTG